MTGIIDVLTRILGIIERITQAEEVPAVVMVIFGIVLVFGLLNCVLGYRLLRFWVMLFGFAAGAFAGLFVVRSMDIEDKMVYLGAMLGIGIALGVVSFLVYKLGIFILGAGIAWTLSIYILHPTTSFIFFICLLCGVIVGGLGVRFAKEVIIVGTSLLGGAMAGFSLSRLGGLSEIPYGIGLSVGFALLGLLIQFATNKTKEEDEEEESEYSDSRNTRQDAYRDETEDYEEDDTYDYLDDYEDFYEEEIKKAPVKRKKREDAEAQPQYRKKRSGR